MELAAYQLLEHLAKRADDEETASMAAEMRQEAAMAERLEDNFDLVVEASLRDLDPDDIGNQLDKYIADAHALENQSVALLQGGQRIAGDPPSRSSSRIIWPRPAGTSGDSRSASRSPRRLALAARDAALYASGLGAGGFFAAQPDTPGKLAGFAFAFEHIEAAGYAPSPCGRAGRRQRDGRSGQVHTPRGALDGQTGPSSASTKRWPRRSPTTSASQEPPAGRWHLRVSPAPQTRSALGRDGAESQ